MFIFVQNLVLGHINLFCLLISFSFSLSAVFPFTSNFMGFIKLGALEGMCVVRGLVYVGVRRYVQVCVGGCGQMWVVMCVCVQVYVGGCARVGAGVLRCALVCAVVPGYMMVWAGVCVWVCLGMCGCVLVCTCVWNKFCRISSRD